MKSKRRHEGYLLLDNRNNEGIPEAAVRGMGRDLPAAVGKGLFEAPTITCSHCQVVVVVNPNRNRERPYCAKCDHYICDTCGAIMAQTKECKPWAKVIEEVQEQAVKQQQKSGVILLT